MTDYTVHIVDDEEPVRKSLAFMLTMNGFAVKMHQSAEAFLAFAPDVRNGVLVTDLRMPDMSGVELLRNLGDLKINIPSIVITGHGDVPMAVEAMKAGAVDFIEKPFEDTVIIEAIERASEHLVAAEADVDDANDIRARLQTLSERERQVLSAVVAGLPNKSIAYDLDISPRTVEVHRANVMAKMKAKSLPHLVRMALAGGFGPS
ncbi:response regulator [Sinorhizobium meliloti]|uniref:Transcriptional regulatory protein FixJ n=2 Tax=Rhizobium meliloti TaxID=382 RepID=FIXJ_RHIME|nr:response regulator FixJ [Sinorhizobium meliloti]P10958.1 RecName: Full=Transcriptional regulatory protein FixJ [Sinorhizobium meliloti 1021]TWA96322.1 LuxR family two component transcriptional regulator [Ensifer sp. SEMIA 134]TWB33947.1 LuxR family two component transcriptional regulator [Ensifer sp. SEMIA 135]AAK65327.1 FixJ response regulator [Sinorhizobium meliloti 1021]AEG07301.1 two component transcriptional regulator, LuxR family [Sinorhizobium meliloti BL225C]AGA09442.1 Response reg